MTILDTSVVIERMRKGEEIHEYITAITLAEFPPLIEYMKFHGYVLYPTRDDIDLAIELQVKLRKIGKPKPFSDLLIAAMCINREEELLTSDMDFKDIEQVSELKATFVGV